MFSSTRYRRDARSMDEDEEMWFNDDEDEEEGEAVEKSRTEDDFSDNYGKYMEAKKGRPHRTAPRPRLDTPPGQGPVGRGPGGWVVEQDQDCRGPEARLRRSHKPTVALVATRRDAHN